MVAQGAMRRAFVGAILLVACRDTASEPVTSNPAPPPVVPPHANAHDAGQGASSPSFERLPYPPGPYGSGIGDVLADFAIDGYAMSRSNRDPRTLPFTEIRLADVRSDPSCTCLVVLWSAAGNACVPAREEDSAFAEALAQDPTMCVIEPIFANGDVYPTSPYEFFAPPTRADVDAWVRAQRETYPVGLATSSAFAALDGRTFNAHPITFVVRPSDMRIVGFLLGTPNIVASAKAFCEKPQTVETLATGLAPTRLSADGDVVFVADAKAGVLRLDGGAPITIAQPGSPPELLALDSTRVYWTAGGELGSAPKSGGPTVVLASSTSAFTGLAIDAKDAWFSRADGVIGRVPLAGGSSETVVSGEEQPKSIAVDDAYVYWIAGGAVMRSPKTGGAPGAWVAPGELKYGAAPVELLSSQGNLYIRAHGTAGDLTSVRDPSGKEIDSDGAVSVPAFAIDPAGSLFLTYGNPATPASPIAGGPPNGLGRPLKTPGQRDVVALATSEKWMVWANGGAVGAVRRLAR